MFRDPLKIKSLSPAVPGTQCLSQQLLCVLVLSLFAQSAWSQDSPDPSAEATAAAGNPTEPTSQTTTPTAAPENTAVDSSPQSASPPAAPPEGNSVDPDPESAAAPTAIPENPCGSGDSDCHRDSRPGAILQLRPSANICA
jgi:hypothetical protein